jgi:hypothetical protein
MRVQDESRLHLAVKVLLEGAPSLHAEHRKNDLND